MTTIVQSEGSTTAVQEAAPRLRPGTTALPGAATPNGNQAERHPVQHHEEKHHQGKGHRPGPPHPPAARGRRRLLGRLRARAARPRLAWCLVAGIGLCLCWSLVTPLMAYPDEPAHLYAAAALVRGQSDTPMRQVGELGREHMVDVPGSLVALENMADCLVYGGPEETAACVRAEDPATVPGRTVTQFGRYPPLYYASVGWPTLIWEGEGAARAARTVSAVLTGTLVGLGVWAVTRFHTGQMARLAVAVALTPAVTTFGGAVNASSLEITAAFAAFAAGTALASRQDTPAPLVWLTGAALTLLVLSRPLGPLWAGLVAGFVVLSGGRGTLRRLAGDRHARLAALPVAAALAGAAGWLALAGRPELLGLVEPHATGWTAVGEVLGALPARARSLVGNFMSLHPPLWVDGLYATGLAALCLAALRGRRRALLLGAGLMATTIVVSGAVELLHVDQFGPWWQVRYSLPLALGVPLLIGGGRGPEPRWVGAVVPAGATVLHGAVLAWLLHRYGAGMSGSWWPGELAWTPPGGLAGVGGLGLLTLVALATALGGRRPYPAAAVLEPFPRRCPSAGSDGLAPVPARVRSQVAGLGFSDAAGRGPAQPDPTVCPPASRPPGRIGLPPVGSVEAGAVSSGRAPGDGRPGRRR